jgi:protein-S-isoprenylcysteine O-methyltransferase Ste14
MPIADVGLRTGGLRTDGLRADGLRADSGLRAHIGSLAERYTPEVVRDLLSRLVVGALFAILSVNLLTDFAHTHHVTGLLLLASESLVVVLTVMRRRTRIVDRSAAAAIVTMLSLVGPSLVRTSASGGLLPDAATAVVSTIGFLIIIAGKVTLGRSFGLVPANRGVVIGGVYGVVRHPIYAGYLLTHVAFACAHPTLWNVSVLVVTDTALVVRALYEERVLEADRSYQSYCQRVAWHIVPGVF